MEFLKDKFYSFPSFSNDLNKWADFVEILCWINPDELMPMDSVSDFYVDSGVSQTDGDSSTVDEKFREIFDYLNHRALVFADFYPFDVSFSEISLKRPLTQKQKSYLMLLFSSNLRLMDSKASKYFTDNFEYLSLLVLSEKLSDKLNVNYFGAGAKVPSLFEESDFRVRLEKLSSHTGLKIKEDFNVEEESSGGDRGLDLVGWASFDEYSKSTLLITAQVTCIENWKDKAHECGYPRWKNILDLRVVNIPFLVLPRSTRSKELKVIKAQNVEESILIDRYVFKNILGSNQIRIISKLYDQCEYKLFYPLDLFIA